MPQARRKTPFSAKAKKQQLQVKKQSKLILTSGSTSSTNNYDNVVALNSQPSQGRGDRNRYALKFYRESNEELMAKKELALQAIVPVPEEELEIDANEYFPKDLSFPKRPPWSFEMSTAQLEMQEQRYFTNYINALEKSPHWKEISYFELNLETWRQLWRVLEMSDIVLIIVDIRFPAMMFPPSLYEHVVKDKGKNMILVLNKIDLVPSSVVVAWKSYFRVRYPGVHVVCFTGCPGYNLRGKTEDKAGLQVRRRKGRQRMCTEGAIQLLDACKAIVEGQVDLKPWEAKIKAEANEEMDETETEIGESLTHKADTSFYEHERFKDNILTIGCVGQPNVGKSSLMNAIMGKKVVSVSRTPGHTKHFQTIFLTPQVRLCDCPGLVFPSKVPRTVQILMGSYPIAQLREPYTTIRYLAERLDLVKLLNIKHPENDETWSPRDICDGWAKKRGYLTAKAARLDTYRAANSILRMALDGKICLWLRPPGFTKDKDKWESSEENTFIKRIVGLESDSTPNVVPSPSESGSDSSSNELVDSDQDADSSSSEEFTAAVANKFAGLITDD